MGTMAADWKSEDFGTSPFFEQLFRQSVPARMRPNGRAADKEQWSPQFCVEVAMWPSWLTRVRIDNFSSYPHMATISSSISRVVGRYRTTTEPQLQKIAIIFSGGLSKGRVCLMN